MIRFEKLGTHDFAVYVTGESDAIGKSGTIGDDSWFMARADLGGGIFWEKTMLAAVAAWAAHGVLKQKVQQLIKREMILARLMPLPGVEEDEDNED